MVFYKIIIILGLRLTNYPRNQYLWPKFARIACEEAIKININQLQTFNLYLRKND
jgi:hypothetical protein